MLRSIAVRARIEGAWPPSSLYNSHITQRTPVHVMALLPLHASVAQSPHPSSHGQVMNDGVMEDLAGTNSVTPGCIQHIYSLPDDEYEYDEYGPVVQVLAVKKLPSGYRSTPSCGLVTRCPHSPLLFVDRRLTLSDGEHCLLAELDPEDTAASYIEYLKPNTLAQLDRIICKTVCKTAQVAARRPYFV